MSPLRVAPPGNRQVGRPRVATRRTWLRVRNFIGSNIATMNNNNVGKKTKTQKGQKRQRSGKSTQNQRPTKQRKRSRAQRKRQAGPGEEAFVAAAYATSQKTGQAQIYRNGVDSCRIIHRELVASISGSSAFTVAQQLPLNPGQNSTFPWLSNEAAGWEKYRFNKLRFCYYTRTGSNVPGSMMLAPDYDASDAPPVSEVVASAYEDTVEDAPWKDICCDLEAGELMGDMNERYVRTGALGPNQDIKTYDSGNLFACTVDGTSVNWGKLWVEYDVTLITPHVPPGGFQSAGFITGNTALSAAAPLGTAPVTTGSIAATVSGQVVTIPNVFPGQEISVTGFVTGTVVTSINFTPVTGMTQKTGLSSDINAAATQGTTWSTYVVNAPNPTLTWNTAATTITSSAMQVVVLAPQPAV